MSTPYPPPPPMPAPTPVAAKAPPFGWAAVVAGLLGLVAFFSPWYTPSVSGEGSSEQSNTSFHAWNGYIFLIIAPVLLILFGALWLQAMRGSYNSRYAGAANPLRAMSLASVISGFVVLVIAVVSLPILHSTFKFDTGARNISWSTADRLIKAAGGKLHSGPQFGLWLLYLGALILIVVGAVGFLISSRATPTAAFGQPGAPMGAPAGYPPAPAYGQAVSPPPGYGAPPAPGYGQPSAPPAPGYGQPSAPPAPGYGQPSAPPVAPSTPDYGQPTQGYPNLQKPGL